MTVQVNNFETSDELNAEFAKKILASLQKGIDEKGKALIAVSGGRTPKALFKILSETEFAWDKVVITLADDRWVEEGHEASNATLVKENLLINKASDAQFVSLVSNPKLSAFEGQPSIESTVSNLPLPFDTVILGMGEDGHTASLFPCSKQIKEGLDVSNPNLSIAVEPTTAPHQRMSFTYQALMNSKQIYLHLVGESKLPVLEAAISGDDSFEMPIRAFMHQDQTPFEVMFANK